MDKGLMSHRQEKATLCLRSVKADLQDAEDRLMVDTAKLPSKPERV